MRLAKTALATALALACAQVAHPPSARVSDHVDVLHGVEVPDPYRWLEDLESDETRAWIEAQNARTRAHLDAIPEREEIRDRLTQLWDHPRYSVPVKRGALSFYRKNDGLQAQSVLYVERAGDASPPRALIDPNALSADGTVSLASYAVSDDGRHVAWATSDGGSDWRTWRVREVETGLDLPEVVRGSKFSGAAWTPDGVGFFYSRYEAPEEGSELEAKNRAQKLYYHRIGTTQQQDRLVYERPDDPDLGFRAVVSEDGAYLVIHSSKGTDRRNDLLVARLTRGWQAGDLALQALRSDFDAYYVFLGNDGPLFYLQTDRDAPFGRIVAVDLRSPAPERWRDVVAESADTLRESILVGDELIVERLHDAHSILEAHATEGGLVRRIPLPSLGSAGGFSARRRDSELFFRFTGFVHSPEIHRYDAATGETTLLRRPDVDFDPAEFETRMHFATSADGARIPLFVVHRRGLARDGRRPTHLYGYGGFDIALTPRFSVSRIAWLERGGIYAHAILRGGGEYGEAWHRAGMLESKPRVFDDFVASAERLIALRYTSPERLSIGGRSNGGLLVGATLNRRPDLFGAAVAGVGVMDMLRFHRWTIGWAWTSDYGSPDDPAMFEVLLGYSPYHNIDSRRRYPPTLVTTADHDDRVFPAHSFKYAARLQAAQAAHAASGAGPHLIRIQTRAGHGAGTPTRMRIEEEADRWAFLIDALR